MKHFTKLIPSLLVLFLLAALTGCSGTSSSTSDEPAAATTDTTATDTTTTQSTDTNGTENNERHDVVFAAPEVDMGGGYYLVEKYIFKTDGTWIIHYYLPEDDGYDVGEGTYTGDPSKDDTLSLIQTKQFVNPGSPLEEMSEPYTFSVTITNGKFTKDDTVYTRE